jgi:hypothetical protein
MKWEGAIGPDPHRLQNVGCLLRGAQRQKVVGVIGAPRRPGQQERLLARFRSGILHTAAVHVESGVQLATEVMDDPHPPGEPGRQRIEGTRGAFEAGQGAGPVALHLPRLALELLDSRIAQGRGERPATVEHGDDAAPRQQSRPVGMQNEGQPIDRACRDEQVNPSHKVTACAMPVSGG